MEIRQVRRKRQVCEGGKQVWRKGGRGKRCEGRSDMFVKGGRTGVEEEKEEQ